jgi:NAD(P)-dependent dehydrogenase (short-subunit alcohol dehydrogenase family)
VELDGRGTIVTGASRGLGAALARALAEAGARQLLVARSGDALEAVVQEARRVAREGGGLASDVHGLVEDVAAPGAAPRIAQAAGALVGPVDLLVCNAATLGPAALAPLLDTAPGDLARAFEVNALAPLRLARAVLGGMVLRGEGVVLLLGSDAAVEAYPGWGAYGASKAALEHLGRTLAAEVGGSGVRVVVADPGEMDTALHRAALPDADPASLARPADVARALVELLADPTLAPNGSRHVVRT